MDKLENMVVEDVVYTEEGRLIAGCAVVSIDGDPGVVTICGPSAEVVKALFAALEVELGL